MQAKQHSKCETARAHHPSVARWAAREPKVGRRGELQAAPNTWVNTLAEGGAPCAATSAHALNLLLRLLGTELLNNLPGVFEGIAELQ